MNLGENIYKFRTQKNMSQGDLADALDVSRQSVSKWENNSAVPELEKLVKMSEIFGITLDELIKGTPAPSAPPVRQLTLSTTVATNELISIVLLILGIVLPVIFIFLAHEANSLLLTLIALYGLPPLFTFGAAYCTPHSKTIYRVFLVYNLLSLIVGAVISFPVAAIACLLNLFVFIYWHDRKEK